jgi:hypothetical protein
MNPRESCKSVYKDCLAIRTTPGLSFCMNDPFGSMIGDCLDLRAGRTPPEGNSVKLVQDTEYDGCGTLEITVDPPRNRVIVTIKSNAPAPNYNAVAGYDLDR